LPQAPGALYAESGKGSIPFPFRVPCDSSDGNDGFYW
jgi:hypothetical protein